MPESLIMKAVGGEVRLTAKEDGTFDIMVIESARSLPGMTRVNVTGRSVHRMSGYVTRHSKRKEAAPS